MAEVAIVERGCRACSLCVDTCPVEVFDRDDEGDLAVVARAEDCIGCLTCHYVCPSQCIEVTDVEVLRPFHRIEGHVALIERFLQEKALASTLSADDLAEAHADVAARLQALSHAVVEIMGRGHRAVGRRAGTVAADHIPEVYEETGLDGVLGGMQQRFRGAFPFDYTLSGDQIGLVFDPCGLCSIVQEAGEVVGEAVLCELFHEYWAGLITAYLGTTYKFEMPKVGSVCEMKLFPA